MFKVTSIEFNTRESCDCYQWVRDAELVWIAEGAVVYVNVVSRAFEFYSCCVHKPRVGNENWHALTSSFELASCVTFFLLRGSSTR